MLKKYIILLSTITALFINSTLTIASVEDLPSEIKMQIFSFLPTNNLVLNASPVCKQWNLLAKDVSLWKQRRVTFVYNKDKFDEGIMSLNMRAWPILKCAFDGYDETSSCIATVKAIAKSRSLEWNITGNSGVDGDSLNKLTRNTVRQMLPALQFLEEFSSLNNHHFDKDASGLFPLLALPLTTLSLGFDGLCNSHFKAIFSCTTLTSLTLESEFGTSFQDGDPASLNTAFFHEEPNTSDSFAQMAQLQNLTALNLITIPLPDTVCHQVIPQLTNLEKLCVCEKYAGCYLTNPTLLTIARACSRIVDLDLRGCDGINDYTFIKAVAHLPALTALGFPSLTTEESIIGIADIKDNLLKVSFEFSKRMTRETLRYLLNKNPAIHKLNLNFATEYIGIETENEDLLKSLEMGCRITSLDITSLVVNDLALHSIFGIRSMQELLLPYSHRNKQVICDQMRTRLGFAPLRILKYLGDID